MSKSKKNQPQGQSQPVESSLLVPYDRLSNPCNPESLGFTSTDELEYLGNIIGQPRAFRALELGSDVSGIGYNIFILGRPDSGRTTLTRDYLLNKARQEEIPPDWCYVNNFENPHQPLALQLPTGRANELRKDMQQMVSECQRGIVTTFSSEEYTRERDQMLNLLKEQQSKAFSELEQHAAKYNFMLAKTPYGLFLGPAIEGKPITPEDLAKLGEEEKQKLADLQKKLTERMEKTLSQVRKLEQQAGEAVHELDQRTSLYIIQPLVQALKERYTGIQAVIDYLERVQADLVENSGYFRQEDRTEQRSLLQEKEWEVRYQVNVLVNNGGIDSAPVVVENQPTYQNLLGSIGHDVITGVAYTNFSHIRPGALHRANGGYLILPARDVLVNPYAWEGLKRVLRDRKIRMLEIGSQMGLSSAVTLEPEPIPLDVKVILVGTPLLYYQLRAYDEDFAKLFKVRAEFATEMDRTPEHEQDYAHFIKSVTLDNNTLPFDRSAAARLIEHSSRLVEDQYKLSTQFGIIADLICEASYWAKKDGQKVVNAGSVQKAIDERIYRSNLVEERIQEMILQDQLVVQVSGEASGQINALAVASLGDYAFGRPNRVSASCSVGQAGVIDIERQAKLGGNIHTKGILIINGLMGRLYGQERPLSLTASLTFEQSYDEVEGDSASAAELIALLSALTGIPINQNMAITGSINQHGQIQTIGGVNAKVEGFFEICRQKGLTGGQGVIIPHSNVRNLMLNEDVRQAVRDGQFHLWSVKTVGEAVTLLTGMPFGEAQPDGSYPEGTFNNAVISRLEDFRQAVKASLPGIKADTTDKAEQA